MVRIYPTFNQRSNVDKYGTVIYCRKMNIMMFQKQNVH